MKKLILLIICIIFVRETFSSEIKQAHKQVLKNLSTLTKSVEYIKIKKYKVDDREELLEKIKQKNKGIHDFVHKTISLNEMNDYKVIYIFPGKKKTKKYSVARLTIHDEREWHQ